MMRGMAMILAGLMGLPLVAQAEGDSAAGEKVFRKCKACHTVEADNHRVGPSLANVIGRTPGSIDGFKYSPAMVDYGSTGIVWDTETLSAYLLKPRDVVKGTRMAFPGLKKDEDRANVIAYLQSVSE